MEKRIELKTYNYEGGVINTGELVFDLAAGTVCMPSGRVLKVVEDPTYTYRIGKRSIKAAGGGLGLLKFLEDINTAGSPFNRSTGGVFIGM